MKNNKDFALNVVTILATKFAIMPLLIFNFVAWLRNTWPLFNHWVTTDPMLLFVILIQACMPTAQNLTLILQLQASIYIQHAYAYT